jgi:hypothetical protein
MLLKIGIAGLAIGALVLGFTRPGVIASVAYAQESSPARTLKADGLSRVELQERFATLPDSALVEFKGKRATVGEIRTKMQQSAGEVAATAKLAVTHQKTASDQASAAAEARRAQSLEHQRTKLAEARAKAMAEFDRERATERGKQKAQ